MGEMSSSSNSSSKNEKNIVTEAGTSDYDEFTDMLNSELDYLEKKYQHKLSTTEYLFCMKKAKYLERVA